MDSHHSQNRFRTVFDIAPMGIAIADREGRFLEANPAACRMFGYSREELIGLAMDDRHPAESMPAIRQLFQAMARGEQPSVERIPLTRPDGTTIDCTHHRHRDGDRRPAGHRRFRGRRHRSAPVGKRARAPGGSGAAGPENGGHRHARRRHCPRLQQPADGDPGQCLPDAAQQGTGSPRRGLFEKHRKRDHARRRVDAPGAGLCAGREIRGAGDRPQPPDRSGGQHVRPLPKRDLRPQDPAGEPLGRRGRPGADGAGLAVLVRQRPGSHARRG